MTDDSYQVRLESIHKRFGDLEVLNGIDMSVRRGEVVVIMGPCGSGKTTLIR
jgi:ABC-type polar amino acid transport system ATPase subunit